MKQELEKILVSRFPQLYQDYDKNALQYPMGWGFQCGDGWFGIIYTMSRRIADHIEVLQKDGRKNINFKFTTIKEKYGTLRAYYEGYCDDIIEKAVDVAEGLSNFWCEVCGDVVDVSTRDTGYIQTLCDKCFDVKKPVKTVTKKEPKKVKRAKKSKK